MLLSATLTFGQALPEKLQGSFNGRVYFDGSAFFKDKTHLGSGATISDIRLGVSGKYEKFVGKIDIGFAKKTVSLKDVFIEYDFKKNSYVRLGHFAEPFGLDYMESSGNIRFINAYEAELLQLFVGIVGHAPLAGGRAVDRQVVHQYHDAVAGEAEVDLEEGRHHRQRLFARFDAVFGIAGHHVTVAPKCNRR